MAADVSHVIGVTNPFWALLLAAAHRAGGIRRAEPVGHRRLKRLGLDDLDPVIRIITTPDGYASLSQLQMVLWTFVVAASAVYVMVLSGELIEVTTGTLVLLGISGAVTVGTQTARQRQSAALPRPAPRPPRKPTWSDLIVNEVNGQREIDITRVQMLYFTLITAIVRGDARADDLRHPGNPARLPDPDGHQQRGLFRLQGGAAGRQHGGGESGPAPATRRRRRPGIGKRRPPPQAAQVAASDAATFASPSDSGSRRSPRRPSSGTPRTRPSPSTHRSKPRLVMNS